MPLGCRVHAVSMPFTSVLGLIYIRGELYFEEEKFN